MASEAPVLPIGNRSQGDLGGRKKGVASGRNRGGAAAGHKAWADFTPTPWLDYGAPWTGGGVGMSPYGSVLHGKKEKKDKGKRDGHVDMAGASPNTPPPTPTSWGATPTPSGLQAMQQNFGFMPPMMGGVPPFMPPGFAAAQFAEAAAAAAGAAAAAAMAAGQFAHSGGSDEETPVMPSSGDGYSDAYDSPPWAQMFSGAPAPPGSELPGGMPSQGSAAHGTGMCRPCAWFWKQSGCQSGAECGYCHLCPEGELKNRKKLKVAAMRMGVLQPAARQERSGARALKLTSLV